MVEIPGRYIFKRAETDRELEQVHQLNYRTFVREVPQHSDPGSERLVDKFHDKSHYFIALSGDRVIGMVSVHDRPPFSAAEKLADPRVLEGPGLRPLEVRLLAIEPTVRSGKIFAGLLWQVVDFARVGGHTHLLISGVAEREDMYRRLGFTRLGPPVKSGSARFIPMMVELKKFPEKIQRDIRRWARYRDAGGNGRGAEEPLSLNPGPVRAAAAVRKAFALPPIYHRGEEFLGLFRGARRSLAALTGAAGATLLHGNGTLANDAVAAALAADRERSPGVVLVNGEFGERLTRHAARAGLRFRVLRWPWGRPWDLGEVERALDQDREVRWVWGVHLESSTGVLNDLPLLTALARERGASVVADCVSSLGAAPVDLSQVRLASSVSGKSLGGYAGIAIAFSSRGALDGVDAGRLPPSLDLKSALEADGPLFTFPSPALRALVAALAGYSTRELAARAYQRHAALGRYVREELRELGLDPLAEERWASPVITTFHPPAGLGSEDFVLRCRGLGYDVGGRSGYLRERRLVQIATMGDVSEADCSPLFERLRTEYAERAHARLG